MTRVPHVTVIVPFLNPGAFLGEAIESVLAQTFDDWEIRLVNDGSSDESLRIADAFVRRFPERVFCHHHDGFANRGLAASRNLALREARGSLVALLDADDVWLPCKLEQQVALLDGFPAAEMAYGRSQYWRSWSGDPADVERDETPDPGFEPERLIQPPALAALNYPLGGGAAPPPSALIVRRGALDRVGGFEEEFAGPYAMYEDQAFLIKLYLSCPVVVGAECWERYRQHDRSICATVSRRGLYGEVRSYFLRWLDRYLREHGVTDPDVTRAFERANRHAPAAEAVETGSGSAWRQRLLTEAAELTQLVARPFGLRDVRFGNGLLLVGAAATPMIAGGLKLELIWRAEAPNPVRQFVAVHLVDVDGTIRSQADYPQDMGIGPVGAGAIWRDVVVLTAAQSRGAQAIALGVFEKGGDLLPMRGAPGDWDGRRVWLRLVAERHPPSGRRDTPPHDRA